MLTTDKNINVVVEEVKRAFNKNDYTKETEIVNRSEKKGYIDPDLECPRCRVKNCMSKQINDRLGGDEGATRYIYCFGCDTSTKMR
jgi:Pyruvate/2-oxoacid:ferredoxin oxidoreductase delta subunit